MDDVIYRCPVCNRWFFEGEIVRVTIKCGKCKQTVQLFGNNASNCIRLPKRRLNVVAATEKSE